MKLIFSTGNANKFHIAQTVLGAAGITLTQMDLDIDEIQGEDGDAIILDKAAKAFDVVKQPVIVSDDSWAIPGLRGFPGPYMKSMNTWFTTADFLRLTSALADRRIFLTNRLAYHDGKQVKLFHNERPGALLNVARGQSKHPSFCITQMEGDRGLSQAEAFSQGVAHLNPHRTATWEQLAAWLKTQT